MTGCLSLSTTQTARVLPEGGVMVTGGAGKFGMHDPTDEGWSTTVAELGMRYGLGSDVDIGGRIAPIGSITLDVKKAMYDDGEAALATGLALGLFAANFGVASTVDLVLPLYLSWHPTSEAALYTVPKAVLRIGAGDSGGVASFVGATAGVRLGGEVGVFIEGTWVRPAVGVIGGNPDGVSLWQANFALFARFGSGVPDARP